MSFSWLTPTPLQVWAVEPGALQITWGFLPQGQLIVQVNNDSPISVVHDGGPGALSLESLTPGPKDIEVRSVRGPQRLTAVVPQSPGGEELCRIATISDLHLGSGNWGALRTIRDNDPGHRDHYDMRCATAAINDAIDWGASLLIIKGDAAHHRRKRDFEMVGQLVDRFPKLPMIMIPGNHDVDSSHPIDMPMSFGKRGLRLERATVTHDFPGVRVIAADTTIEHRGYGTIEPTADQILEEAGDASTPNLIALHHQFQEYPVPTYWPPGISSRESKKFLRALNSVAPNSLVTSGHTHRNRARTAGSVQITEVASTKDWPGVWAGYRVFDGGIYQTVRRVAAPSAISWTEYSRRALFGAWSSWSPGQLEDRCVGFHTETGNAVHRPR